MVDQWNSLNQAAAAVYRHTVLPTKLPQCAELYESGRTVLRKCSTQMRTSFYANARIVVRKCVHCLKWRWSSPGSGSRCTIAVFVHHWCTIAALLQSQRYNVALSCSHNVAISSTCTVWTIITLYAHNWCTIAVATVHCCTIMLSQRCNIALSCSHDIVIMFYHKV